MYFWWQQHPICSGCCHDASCSGEGAARAAHSTELVGAGNRQKSHSLLSWRGRNPTLLGTAAAAQSQLWTQATLQSRGPGNSPCPCRFKSACSRCLASPHSWCLFPLQSKVEAKPRHCRDPARCAHTWGSTDTPAPCRPSRHWAPTSIGGRLQGWGGLRAAQSGPAGAPWHEQPGCATGTRDSREMADRLLGRKGKVTDEAIPLSQGLLEGLSVPWTGELMVLFLGLHMDQLACTYSPLKPIKILDSARLREIIELPTPDFLSAERGTDYGMTCMQVGATRSGSPLCWGLHRQWDNFACGQELLTLGSPPHWQLDTRWDDLPAERSYPLWVSWKLFCHSMKLLSILLTL